MSSIERKIRRERQRRGGGTKHRPRDASSRKWFLLVLVLVALLLWAMTALDPVSAGRVWSPEHGHWH